MGWNERPESECVLSGWSVDRSNGYARSRKKYAHRVAWEEVFGPIPEGLTIHHLCGVKTCINVDHMVLLTRKTHGVLHSHLPQCDHERKRKKNGHTRCPTCEAIKAREWQLAHRKELNAKRRARYRNDSEYRERILKRVRERKASGRLE